MDIFGTGVDKAVWSSSWNGTSWSSWTSLGGCVTSSPVAVSGEPNYMYLFAKVADNSIITMMWNGYTWRGLRNPVANQWQNISGNFSCPLLWSCPGDLDDDSRVTVADLFIVISHFGQTPVDAEWDPRADANKDDMVSFEDLTEVISNFGKECN